MPGQRVVSLGEQLPSLRGQHAISLDERLFLLDCHDQGVQDR
jgi:hypothetical protein